jgi:hypothetical protein
LTKRQLRGLEALGWIVLAAPALWQLWLIAHAIGPRIAYPYDLEWMEGGMLHHAHRLATGHALYPAPNIEFIPYLYTPLYPALLAMLGGMFGLTYTLARMISVLSLVGIAVVGAVSIASPRYRHSALGPALAGVILALGLFAAIYPFVEGWFDIARADSMFLFMVTAGLVACAHWTWREPDEPRTVASHARVGAAAAILALAFFAKQTGILYVALGGVVVLVIDWRLALTYAGVAGVVGLGFTALLNFTTHGWFWTYIRKIHAAHDFNMDRFWRSFGYILWHFRALTVIVLATLPVVLFTWLRPPPAGARRELPRQTRPFLLWTAAFAVSTLVGAIGWGTEFAHFNAYMPAFLHGALAAGAAIPALATCTAILWGARPHPRIVASVAPAIAVIALSVTLAHAKWQPAAFVPTARDVAAGDKLIARIRELPGDVWIPSHPWYLVLAGKQPHVHRMGITDVTWRQSRQVIGLDAALLNHRFAALVLDDRDVISGPPQIRSLYRAALRLPADERPRVYTGAKTVPDSIWVPAMTPTPPPGAHVVFNFEMPTWDGWTRSGGAWGQGPEMTSLPGQDLVVGATGQRFATSMHDGDAATGRVTSPSFTLDGEKLSLSLGGTSDATHLRVELWVDRELMRTAAAPLPGGDTLRPQTLDISDLRGKQATLVLVDDSPRGHMDIDDVWLWDAP